MAGGPPKKGFEITQKDSFFRYERVVQSPMRILTSGALMKRYHLPSLLNK